MHGSWVRLVGLKLNLQIGPTKAHIGAKVVSHAKYLVFQLAEVAVPRQLFSALVERIGRLRLARASG
jgi:hypothetical protein